MPEDESYLNKRGLTHFWENIDDIKQNKLTAGAGILITNDVISATGGGTADAVDWGHITGSMSNQTDLTTALAAKANSADLATVATSGDYDDLTNKPTIGTGLLTLKNNNVVIGTFSANSTSARTITVTTPTKTSDLTNDSGFLTSYTETDPIYSASPAAGITATDISSWDAKSDFSGSYNDLTDKPTIGNATLTIQKNGTSAGTFTANATSNKTINITVPTTAADVSALPASTKYGASIEVSVNTTNYKVTTTLKDQDGNTLGTAQVIDLPLESVVVNGSYDSTNKKIVLTLQSGSTIDIPVADLVAGLQSEITSTNKLASDLVDDTNQTHKFMTSAEKTKLSGIAAGAEVNVQANWAQTTTTADDYIKNKPTLATVATSGSYNDLSNKPTIPAAQVQSNWTQTTTTAVDYIKNKPTLAAVATSGSYNDLSNKPTIPTVNNATLTIQKNGTTVKTFTANASSNVTANITVPTKTSDLTNDSGFVNSTAIAGKQDLLTAGDHINITGTTIKAIDYVHSEQPVSTSAVTPVVTGNMISNGTITADKLASGATVKLTLSTSDIGEGSALAANTLYGVYQ